MLQWIHNPADGNPIGDITRKPVEKQVCVGLVATGCTALNGSEPYQCRPRPL